MKRTPKALPAAPAQPPEFPRADPVALSRFDASTTTCTMNCGPHRLDQRSEAERRFLCGDCLTTEVNP